MSLKNKIRKILREEVEIKSNYDLIIDNFKNLLPKEYHEKIDEVFKHIKDFIISEGFKIKVLNNCQVPYLGARTKKFIILCSPKNYRSLADLVYLIFHEIRHEIQMGKLKMRNPMAGDIENFDELYKMYWDLEIDAHNYGLEWVNKVKDMINLPDNYYRLSQNIVNYPSIGHHIRNMVEQMNNTIKKLKSEGHEYSDLGDLPMIKNIIDKLEDLF
jgi:hypothetical protein